MFLCTWIKLTFFLFILPRTKCPRVFDLHLLDFFLSFSPRGAFWVRSGWPGEYNTVFHWGRISSSPVYSQPPSLPLLLLPLLRMKIRNRCERRDIWTIGACWADGYNAWSSPEEDSACPFPTQELVTSVCASSPLVTEPPCTQNTCTLPRWADLLTHSLFYNEVPGASCSWLNTIMLVENRKLVCIYCCTITKSQGHNWKVHSM